MPLLVGPGSWGRGWWRTGWGAAAGPYPASGSVAERCRRPGRSGHQRECEVDAPVPMLMIVKFDELGDELPGGLQGAEPFREHWRVLQRLVPRLAEWIVVGNPWPGMGTGHTKIIQQGRDRLTGHRRPTIGVHHLRDALNSEDLGHQIDGQHCGLGVVHVRADDVPRVDVDHHVAVEVHAPGRAGEFRYIPAVDLPGTGGL